MKPAYWIGILALLGGILGYAINWFTGWWSTIPAIAAGMLIGLVIYARQTGKIK